MQILIDMDEEVFNEIMSVDDDSHLSRAFLNGSYLYSKEALQNGTPLPKGHGRLIDEREVKKMIEEAKVNSEHSKTFAENIIKFAPTIIEADKEVEI